MHELLFIYVKEVIFRKNANPLGYVIIQCKWIKEDALIEYIAQLRALAYDARGYEF